MTLVEVLLAIAIIGSIVTLFSETLFQFAKIKERGQSEAMDHLSGPQMIADIQDVLLRIRPCSDPTKSVVRKQPVADGSKVAAPDAKAADLLPGLLYGNSEELCVVATNASGETNQWMEFCNGNLADSGASLLSKLSGRRASVPKSLFQEPVLIEVPHMQTSSQFSGSSLEVRVRKLTQAPLQLRFEFFDGLNWLAEWDSSLMQKLPKAIRVTIMSRSPKTSSAVSKRQVSTLLLENPNKE